jgi:hypothetical protein
VGAEKRDAERWERDRPYDASKEDVRLLWLREGWETLRRARASQCWKAALVRLAW